MSLDPSPIPFPIYNISRLSICEENLRRNSCLFDDRELAARDAIATLRVVISSLSILGSISIIVSVLWRRILFRPKAHPIFVISVADCVLGLSWVLGGLFWYGRLENRAWCFLPSLTTVIMQCVTVNLTVVYALVAYGIIKHQDFSAVLSNTGSSVSAWKPWKTAAAYAIAWLLPVVLVLLGFSIVASLYGVVQNANDCSCWCLPYFGNVLPLASQADWATSVYVFHIRKLVLAYGIMLLVTYLLGFMLLVFIYSKVLAHIRRERRAREHAHPPVVSYGAVAMMLMKGHSQAKKRVVYFLSVFIITGIANLILSFIFVIVEAQELQKGASIKPLGPNGTAIDHLDPWYKAFLYIVQSLTTPLQGFLNALVYGWTRSDFVRVGRSRRRKHGTHHSLEESLSSYDYSDDEKPTPTSSLVPGIDSGYFDRRNTGQGTPRSSRSDTGLSRTLPGRPRTRSGAGGSGRGREKGRGTSAASSWKSAESRLTSSDGCSADPSSWYQNKAGADIQGNGTG